MYNKKSKSFFNTACIKKAAALFLATAALITCLSGCKIPFLGMSEAKMREALAGDFIYNGISVYGTDVGGLTEAECVAALKERFASKEKETLFTASFEDKSWNISPEFLGTTYDYEGAAKEAFAYARGENLEENYESFLDLENNPIDFDLNLIINDSIINSTVDRIAEEIT